MEKISREEECVRQKWIDALMKKGYTRDQIAKAAGVTTRQVSRWRSAGETYAPDDGQAYLIVRKLGVDPPADMDIDKASGGLSQQEIDALRNAAILFRDADTGKVFFSMDFPSYMRVWNPYVVTLKKPDVKNGEAKMVEKGEDVS